jgi:guanine deaminase
LVTERGADGVARIKAIGPHALLQGEYAQVPCTDWRGKWIAPGFVDLHIHYAQTDVIASPADGLLPWLNNYTFPQETRFADPAHAHEVAHFFFDELLRNGVTTALTFATAHTASVDAFFQEAQRRQLRMLSGRVLQDRHSPDGLRDVSAQQSLYETEALIARWHGVDRLGYAITPRFAPTSSEAQLRGAGELAASHPSVWVQTHVAENADEIQWVAELFPQARSYLGVYEDMGLLRERSVYAHCLHLDASDRDLMAERGAAAAVCPTSNLFLDSGFFNFELAQSHHLQHGLASDVGGGTSFSPFHTMHAAYTVGRQSAGKNGHSLSAEHLWWLHTAGAAQALGLGGVVGNLAVGCDADFVVLNPQATPLLARRTAAAESLQEQLFAMIVLGDDRLIERVVVNGQTT